MKALLVLPAILGALAVAAPAGAVGSPWDTTFSGDGKATTDFGANDAANDVLVQPDGKIVAVGTMGTDYGAFVVARYNIDGSLDTSFSGDGKAGSDGGFATGSQAFAVARQSDGKLVLAGNVCGGLGCDFQLQRYNTNGSLDTGFNGNGRVGVSVGGLRHDTAFAVAIQPDGKILAAGTSCLFGDCDIVVMRFLTGGALDPAFGGGIVVSGIGSGGTSTVHGVGVQSNGTVLVVGTHYEDESPPCPFGETCFSIIEPKIAVVRYSSGGAFLDANFARYLDGESSQGDAMAIQADDRIVVAGLAIDGSFERDVGVARFAPAGTLDAGFSGDGRQTTNVSGIDLPRDVALQSGGSIVAVGASGANGHLVRYTAAGDLDPTFNGDGMFTGSFAASAAAIAPDGKIVVVGTAGGDFTVSRFVENGGDGTPPVLAVPWRITVEATGPSGAVVNYLVGATDNEDPSPDVACTHASGSTFPLGDTTVSCTATDDEGNKSTRSFVVRVVDTTPPTILAGTIRMNAESAAGVVVNYLVDVRDTVDRRPSLNCQPPSGSVFPIGTTTVTCVATDASGNRSKRSFRVLVLGFHDQLGGLIDEIANLPLTGPADLRRDNALQFCINAFWWGYWATNTMPRTNDDGRFALTEIRQCVLYLKGPPAEVGTASESIRLALIDLVCRIAHSRYDEVSVAPGANAARLVQARTSLDQADAAPGTDGALFDCVNAWSILQNEPPQY